MEDWKQVEYEIDTHYKGFSFVSPRGFMNCGEGGYQVEGGIK